MKMTKRYWLIVVALVIPITFAGAHPAQRLGQGGDESTTRQQIAQDFGNALLVANDHYAGQIDFGSRRIALKDLLVERLNLLRG